MSDSRSISGKVSIESDSGSPQRVAYDLCMEIARVDEIYRSGDFRKDLLDLYAECLRATKQQRR